MNEVACETEGPFRVKITGMDCGGCAMTIEDSIRKLPGVQQADVSFTTESMQVEGDISLDVIEKRLQELGYKIASTEPQYQAELPDPRGAMGFVQFLWGQPPLRMSMIVASAVIAGLLTLPGLSPIFGIEPLSALFATAVVVAGAPVFIKGFRALVFANRITIDLLMAIACIGALAIGELGEATTVILLFMLGEALEAYSAERARDSLRSLMALQPQEATILQADDDSQEHSESCSGDHDHQHNEAHQHNNHQPSSDDHAQQSHDHTLVISVDKVVIGDRVLVRPGQRIPVDGVVIKGLSTVNQAPVTGESVPVAKDVDDEVMAGTVNGEAALEIRTSKIAAEGTIARIAKLVEQAQAQRSPPNALSTGLPVGIPPPWSRWRYCLY